MLDQVTGSLIATAYNVLNEGAAAADHTNRLAYANAIFVNPVAQAQFLLPALMTNATLQGEAGNAAGASGTPFADSDVDFVIASVFSTYADQYVAQLNSGAALKLGS